MADKTTTMSPEMQEFAKALIAGITANNPAQPAPDMQALAKAIVDGITLVAPRKTTPYGQHKIAGPFNPTGKRDRKLKRVMFQNGHKFRERMLHDEEIRLLDLIKQGRYIDGLVDVLEGEDGLDRVVHIRYKNKTVDQRQELQSRVPTLVAMLQRIVTEHSEKEAALKAARIAQRKADEAKD